MDTSNLNVTKCNTCQSDALKSCTNCRNVHYCTVDCQKSDWKSHKTNCWPVKIITEGETRKLVTTREVQENELIWSEVPIVIAPDSQIHIAHELQLLGQPSAIICVACNTNISHKKNICSKCQWPVCDVNCERDPRHAQRECKIFQFWSPGRTSTKHNHFLGIIRILFLKATDPPKWNNILQLKFQDPASKELKDTQIQIANLFQNLFARISIKLSIEECFHGMNAWSSAWASNPLIGGNELQKELYHTSTFIIQDCLPNTRKLIQQSPGKEQRLKFYAKSKLSPGTTLTQTWRFDDNYPTGTWYRRHLVNEMGGGWCKCSLCSDPTENNSYASALKCPNHSRATNVKAYLLPINPLDQDSDWECNTCKETFPRTKILDILDPIRNKLNSLMVQAKHQQLESIDFERAGATQLTASDKSLVKTMIQYDKELNSVVHPNHYVKLILRAQILSGLNHLICPMSPNVPVPMRSVGDGTTQASFGMIVFWRDDQRENMEKMHKMVLEVLPVIEAIAPDTFTHYRVMYFHAMTRWTYVALAMNKQPTDSNSAAQARQVLIEAEALSEKLQTKIMAFKDSKFNELPLAYQTFNRNLKKLNCIKETFTRINFAGMHL